MYTFRIYDPEIPKEKQKTVTQHKALEFTDIVNSEDTFSKVKVAKIKKSKIELVKRKPRNIFMIFRCLAKQLILHEVPYDSFASVSKICSIIWSKRTLDLEKYLRYLENEDEKYQDNIVVDRTIFKKKTEKKKTRYLAELTCSSNKTFRYYKVHKHKIEKNTKTDSKESIVRKKIDSSQRIEDVFINN